MSLRVHIKKRLGDFSLDVDLESNNDRLALLGSSGCGKSVTLRCISGIMTPDEGHIELDGKVLFDSREKMNLPPQKRHIGYLFQQYALFPNMTVEQNIKSVLRDKADRDETVKRLLRTLQLEDVASGRPAQLSGGQQQRLALARILASKPKTLLLDEPFSALDSYLKAQLEQELADMLDTFGGDVIWVSHDRDEVFRNCTKISIIDNGTSQPALTPSELFNNPQTISAAKLSGCKNIIKVLANDRFVFIPDWNLTLNCGKHIPPEISAIGIRAHHIHFSDSSSENRIHCSVIREKDNVFSAILILRPIGSAQDSPSLRMELGKDLWIKYKGAREVSVFIAPQDILLLK